MPARDDSCNDFLKLLSEHESILFRVCLMFTDRQPQNVKDLYQEIAYNLWRSHTTFRSESAVSTWVYRVALNTAVSQRRHDSERPAMLELDKRHYEELADESNDAMVERLYELIDKLSPTEKKMIFMYLDRLSMRDIAAEMHLSVLTVRQRIHRIKQKIIKLNQDEE